MSDELKPVRCGCGGEAKIRPYRRLDFAFTNKTDYYVQCDKCGISTLMKDTEGEAIEAWNKAMGLGEPKWWCNLCACYDKQRCYCNLHGIWVASDFGCKAFEPYCDEEDWSGNE